MSPVVQVNEVDYVNPCSPQQHHVSLGIQLDNSNDRVRWNIKRRNKAGNFKKLMKRGVEKGARSSSMKNICLKKGFCYRLTVIDTGKDGLCCKRGKGKYVLGVNNELIKQSSMKGKKRERKWLGDC